MSAAYNLKKENLVDVLTHYKDICATIEYYEIILDDIERDYQRTRKVLIGGPKAKPSHLSIDRQYEGTKDTLYNRIYNKWVYSKYTIYPLANLFNPC